MAVPVLGAQKIMKSVKSALKKNRRQVSYHHDWMIKAKSNELYFTGKETTDQIFFDFEK